MSDSSNSKSSASQALKNQQVRRRKKWSLEQTRKYCEFIERQRRTLEYRQKKQKQRIYNRMAAYVGTRTTHQCRSHHQKVIKRYNSIDGFIRNFRKRLAEERRFDYRARGDYEAFEAIKNEVKGEYRGFQNQNNPYKNQGPLERYGYPNQYVRNVQLYTHYQHQRNFQNLYRPQRTIENNYFLTYPSQQPPNFQNPGQHFPHQYGRNMDYINDHQRMYSHVPIESMRPAIITQTNNRSPFQAYEGQTGFPIEKKPNLVVPENHQPQKEPIEQRVRYKRQIANNGVYYQHLKQPEQEKEDVSEKPTEKPEYVNLPPYEQLKNRKPQIVNLPPYEQLRNNPESLFQNAQQICKSIARKQNQNVISSLVRDKYIKQSDDSIKIMGEKNQNYKTWIECDRFQVDSEPELDQESIDDCDGFDMIGNINLFSFKSYANQIKKLRELVLEARSKRNSIQSQDRLIQADNCDQVEVEKQGVQVYSHKEKLPPTKASESQSESEEQNVRNLKRGKYKNKGFSFKKSNAQPKKGLQRNQNRDKFLDNLIRKNVQHHLKVENQNNLNYKISWKCPQKGKLQENQLLACCISEQKPQFQAIYFPIKNQVGIKK